ncbi:MAG: hypothetical protein KAX51_08215 [Chromatiaceae bacterium]|nr:hypothetical protein [Chromatiaceae bacterium]
MGLLASPNEKAGSVAKHADAEKQETYNQQGQPELAFNVEQVFGYTTNNGVGLLLIISELGQLLDGLLVSDKTVNNPLKDCLDSPCQKDGADANRQSADYLEPNRKISR